MHAVDSGLIIRILLFLLTVVARVGEGDAQLCGCLRKRERERPVNVESMLACIGVGREKFEIHNIGLD